MIKKVAILALSIWLYAPLNASEGNDDNFIAFSGSSQEDNESSVQKGIKIHGKQNRNKNEQTRNSMPDNNNEVQSEEMHEVDKLSTDALEKIVKREDNIEQDVSEVHKELSDLKSSIKEFANKLSNK